ncbi:hypothetical protein [Acinetobacter rudis]|uniref:hypothetical protein n=1 Tax=Acinetobacter rudis TaxID=632955 RepID=UPI00334118E2
MIQKIWFNFKQQDIPIKIYIIAIIIFLIALINIGQENSSIFLGIIYISMILFEIGFVIWIFALSRKYLKLKYLNFFWLFFHLVVLWLAAVYASMVVSQGLGLPASDFNYTVSFLTFFCYPPAFLFISTGLGVIVYLSSIIIYAFLSIFVKPKFFESFSIFHIIGGLITIGLFAFGHDKIMSFYLHNAPKYVRFIAYETDYQPAPIYLEQFPEMDKTMKIKLHENGVYSTIEKSENGYELIVGTFQ